MPKLKNPKAKGSRLERRSKALLEAQGYLVCKAGGSLGAFDLFCIGPSDVLLVQVKANRKPSPAEMEVMKRIPTGPFVEKLVHIWKDRKKEPRVIYLDAKVERELHPISPVRGLMPARAASRVCPKACGCGTKDWPGHDCKAWPWCEFDGNWSCKKCGMPV